MTRNLYDTYQKLSTIIKVFKKYILKRIKEILVLKYSVHRAPDYVDLDYVNFSLKISPCDSIMSIFCEREFVLFVSLSKFRLCQFRFCLLKKLYIIGGQKQVYPSSANK
jgi:hypothetical protein